VISLIGTFTFSNDAQPFVPADRLRQPLTRVRVGSRSWRTTALGPRDLKGDSLWTATSRCSMGQPNSLVSGRICLPCRLHRAIEREANRYREMRKVRGNFQPASSPSEGYLNSFSILNGVANPINAQMPSAMEWTNFIGILAAN
jgi:hypothetical protein